ncbi:hypothetical protein MRX96_048991 [Rhipicephalus microplus]
MQTACHQQLSRAVTGDAGCVAVRQENQEPVRRLLLKFFGRAQQALEFTVRLRVPGIALDVGVAITLGKGGELCRQKLRFVVTEECLGD